jgi:hypothetical protein
VTKTILWLQLYHPIDQVLSFLAHDLINIVGRWPLNVSILDIFVNGMSYRSFEWHMTSKHFE